MDPQEPRQFDLMAARVQKVRKKARPWRSMIMATLAVAGLVAAEFWGVNRRSQFFNSAHMTATTITLAGGVAFAVFGMSAIIGLAGMARATLQPVVGQAHAAVVRYVLMLFGVFLILFTGLTVFGHESASQLLIGTAVTGVLLGIAAQQSLANLFAGLVLLFARPFRVGDKARFRSGALSGQVEGIVVDISLTYVRLATEDGPVLIPNSQALAAAVLLVSPPAPGAPPPDSGDGQGAAAPGTAADRSYPGGGPPDPPQPYPGGGPPDPPQPYPGGGPPDPPQQSAGVLGAAAGDHPDARSQARPSSATSASDWPHTSQ